MAVSLLVYLLTELEGPISLCGQVNAKWHLVNEDFFFLAKTRVLEKFFFYINNLKVVFLSVADRTSPVWQALPYIVCRSGPL